MMTRRAANSSPARFDPSSLSWLRLSASTCSSIRCSQVTPASLCAPLWRTQKSWYAKSVRPR
eukprot:743577-Lingulodinium_polyedra.AAC.1